MRCVLAAHYGLMADGGRQAQPRREEATAAHHPLEMETASRRQSATSRVWGSIGSAEIFAEGTAYTTTKVRRAPRWTDLTADSRLRECARRRPRPAGTAVHSGHVGGSCRRACGQGSEEWLFLSHSLVLV
jgi:hypothetical protein